MVVGKRKPVVSSSSSFESSFLVGGLRSQGLTHAFRGFISVFMVQVFPFLSVILV